MFVTFAHKLLFVPDSAPGSGAAPGGDSVTDGVIAPLDISGRLAGGDNSQPAAPKSEPVTVDFDALATEIGTAPATAAKPTAEIPVSQPDYSKPVDLKAAAVKKDEPQAKPQEPPAKPPTEPSDTTPKRDYTGFSDEDKEVLSKLPNKLFDRLSQWRRGVAEKEAQHTATQEELAKIKSGALPDSYFAHKEGYMLSPDYRKNLGEYQHLKREEAIWDSLDDALRRGDKVLKWPKQWNERGELVTQDYPVTEDNAAAISRTIARAIQNNSSAQQGVLGALSNLEGTWNARHTALLSNIKSAEAQYFPFFEKIDETKPDGKAAAEALKAVDSMIQLPELRSYPLHNMFLKSAATNILLTQRLSAAMQEIEQLKGRKADTKLAGPTATETSTATATGAGKVFDPRDWDK